MKAKLKVMRALKSRHPEIDFKTLSREDVVDQNLPCRTIAAAVEPDISRKCRDMKTWIARSEKCLICHTVWLP